MVKKIDHIGVVVKNIEKTLEIYEKLFGLKPTRIETLSEGGVKGAFIPIGDIDIELLEITGSPSEDVAKVLSPSDTGLHHICFEVENVDEELRSLAASGVKLVDREGHQGLSGKIGFLHPDETEGVYVEFVQIVTSKESTHI